MKPRLLDLFCGAGGCAMGYHYAGFDVTGVDIAPMPRYPFAFVQADALEYVRLHGHEYDAIHASPPCQGYSRMRHLPWLKGREYPMLLEPTREALRVFDIPWVIENVEDAPFQSGITLCGMMFGLKVYRHRRFESNLMLLAPPHRKHDVVIGSGHLLNDRRKKHPDGWVTDLGKDGGGEAVGIDWMTRDELTQAIPPAYCEFIGDQLMAFIERTDRAA